MYGLKRSGAWWYAANSNHIQRCAVPNNNGTLDQVFGSAINRRATEKKKCQNNRMF